MIKNDKGTELLSAEKPKAKGKEESKAPEKKSGGKAKSGMKLHEIRTRILDDGTVAHEHHYKDKNGMPHHQTHEYSSADIRDVHDHMDEHVSPEMSGGQQAAGEGDEGGAGDESAEAPQAAAPQASQAAGEGEGEE